jgi:ATPase family AAA domain-containing protein 3A/B
MLFLSGAYFLSKYSLALAFKRIEAILARPSLVRETSRRSLKWIMPSSKKIFDRIILNPELENVLKLITAGFIAK